MNGAKWVGDRIGSPGPGPTRTTAPCTVAEFTIRLDHMLTVAPNLDRSDMP